MEQPLLAWCTRQSGSSEKSESLNLLKALLKHSRRPKKWDLLPSLVRTQSSPQPEQASLTNRKWIKLFCWTCLRYWWTKWFKLWTKLFLWLRLICRSSSTSPISTRNKTLQISKGSWSTFLRSLQTPSSQPRSRGSTPTSLMSSS